MTVLFGTLGWRPQSLMPSIKSTEGLEKVVLAAVGDLLANKKRLDTLVGLPQPRASPGIPGTRHRRDDPLRPPAR